MALTSHWYRPVQPAPPEPKAVRQLLLSADDRETLRKLDQRAQAIKAEIAALFNRAGLSNKQRAQQLRSVRKG